MGRQTIRRGDVSKENEVTASGRADEACREVSSDTSPRFGYCLSECCVAAENVSQAGIRFVYR